MLLASFVLKCAHQFCPATKLPPSCLEFQFPLTCVTIYSFLFANKSFKTIQVSGNFVELVPAFVTHVNILFGFVALIQTSYQLFANCKQLAPEESAWSKGEQ